MSKNFWIKKANQKNLHLSIDQKAMDCWSMDQDLGAFLQKLTKEELDYFHSFKLKDFAGDPDEPSFGFEIYCE